VERCIVTVLVMPESTAALLLLPERPVTWNGKLYWKHVVFVSAVIVNPYVAKYLRLVGTSQVYFPTALSMPAGQVSSRRVPPGHFCHSPLMMSAADRVLGVAP